MEIEPEVLDPQGRPTRATVNMPGKWKLIIYGAVAVVIGLLLLYVMFWVALVFLALGAITLGINLIRSWIRGEKPIKNSQASVKFYIGNKPPRD